MPDGGPRISGFEYKGLYRYSLTICVHDRCSVFVEADIVNSVLQQIQRTAAADKFDVLAYCFMPDHVHLLDEGQSDDANLQKFMKAWKQVTGFEYAQHNCGRRLWQVGFFDRVLRSDESTEAYARYILANPVRAGLAASVDEYPFAGPRGVWPHEDGWKT